ncbi:MAG: sigma-54 dependent transcriptional regulator [Brevinematales bacterium]|jgi:two-component system nitrogen regulation response regulator NtrX
MKLLIVDDNEDVISSLKGVFGEYEIIGADCIKNAKKILALDSDSIDIAVIDMKLGDEDGIDLLSDIKQRYPFIECVMISGYSSVEKAVQSIKMGAFDFVEKPISYQKMKVVINNALEHKMFSSLLKKEMEKYKIIGESPAVKKMNDLIEKAAQNDFPVLITGESGVGKEHVAHLIHLKSKRGKNEMIKQNCAAIPENLFESELFGHEKGAFTGASGARKGKLELAGLGTLFLDEVGDMPLSQQAKLLRALEDREITRVGGETRTKVDFRLICATNRNLKEAVEEGKFREDFFYRIGVLVVNIPPLRERKEDIKILAEHFFRQACIENGSVIKTISQEAMSRIIEIPLKGNIRELKNMMQRLYAFSESDAINPDDVGRIMGSQNKDGGDAIFQKTMQYSEAKKLLEKKYIVTQLALNGNNVSRTALSLGILPNNLQRKIKDLEIVLNT